MKLFFIHSYKAQNAVKAGTCDAEKKWNEKKKNADERILCLVKNEWFLEQAEDAGGIGHLNDKIFKKKPNKQKNHPKTPQSMEIWTHVL